MCMSGPKRTRELRVYLGNLVKEIDGRIKVWGEEGLVKAVDGETLHHIAQGLRIKEIQKSPEGKYHFNIGGIGGRNTFTIPLDENFLNKHGEFYTIN